MEIKFILPPNYVYDAPPLPPQTHNRLIPLFAAVHTACISNDHTTTTFIPPLDQHKVTFWWAYQAAEVAAGKGEVIFTLAPTDRGEGAAAGVVMLFKANWETGRFGVFVEKLLGGGG